MRGRLVQGYRSEKWKSRDERRRISRTEQKRDRKVPSWISPGPSARAAPCCLRKSLNGQIFRLSGFSSDFAEVGSGAERFMVFETPVHGCIVFMMVGDDGIEPPTLSV